MGLIPRVIPTHRGADERRAVLDRCRRECPRHGAVRAYVSRVCHSKRFESWPADRNTSAWSSAWPSAFIRPSSAFAVPNAVLSMNHILELALHRGAPASFRRERALEVRDLPQPSIAPL